MRTRRSPFSKWLLPIIFTNATLALCAFFYYLGMRSVDQDISKITEVHFIDPKLLKGNVDYSLLGSYRHALDIKLRLMKPPYDSIRIHDTIVGIMPTLHPERYVKILKVTKTDYRIQVTEMDSLETRSRYYILTPKDRYYLKPLKIIEDLKP